MGGKGGRPGPEDGERPDFERPEGDDSQWEKPGTDRPEWQQAKQEHLCQVIPARIILESEDPDGLKGINMEKLSKANQMAYPILKPYLDRRENKEQWCIAAVPGAAWAKKVFPGMRTSQAMEKLWEEIFKAVRITGCGDAVDRWRKHCKVLEEKREKLFLWVSVQGNWLFNIAGGISVMRENIEKSSQKWLR